jgi:glycosyltransferase involved in cell wall biosynthesis
MSFVDVIVPCYKYGRYLEACVQSVLSQEGVDVRVLILDDASPDHTPEVGRRLAAQDSRVEYRRHRTNQRVITTVNEGLAWSGRDYTVVLSADDLLAPGCLYRATRLMNSDKQVGLTYGRCLRFSDDEPPAQGFGDSNSRWKVVSGRGFFEGICGTASNPVYTPTVVTRTSVQKEIGGFLPELPHTADLAMWLHFAARGSIGWVDAVQGISRVHAQSMSKTEFNTPLLDLQQRRLAFDLTFAAVGDHIPDSEHLHNLATQVLAREAFWSASRAFDQGDSKACRDLLAFASALVPAIQNRREWSRLRWKRRLGTKVWSVLRPLIERWRGRPARVVSRET